MIRFSQNRSRQSRTFFVYRHRLSLFLLCLLPLLISCEPEPTGPLKTSKLQKIDQAIEKAVRQGKTPGGVFWLEHKGGVYTKAYGYAALQPQIAFASIDTLYDSASLTKVMATAPAILILMERGEIELDAQVKQYLEDFDNGGKESITIRHLLTHTSGLRPGIDHTVEVNGIQEEWNGYETAIALAKAEKAQHPPGTQFIYSDINYIILGEIIEQISGMPLEEFTRKEIFKPLGMSDTGYLPSPKLRERIAPTKWVDGEMLRGIANNPICRKTGGVHGHAGIFTTAPDMAKFARMILNKGNLEGVRLLQPENVELMTSIQSPESVSSLRGLGWDIDSSYSSQRGEVFPIGGFGHTGFAGPSIWIDPFSQTIVIFMTNRIHPDGTGDVRELRRQIGTLSAEALVDFDFESIPNITR